MRRLPRTRTKGHHASSSAICWKFSHCSEVGYIIPPQCTDEVGTFQSSVVNYSYGYRYIGLPYIVKTGCLYRFTRKTGVYTVRIRCYTLLCALDVTAPALRPLIALSCYYHWGPNYYLRVVAYSESHSFSSSIQVYAIALAIKLWIEKASVVKLAAQVVRLKLTNCSRLFPAIGLHAVQAPYGRWRLH